MNLFIDMKFSLYFFPKNVFLFVFLFLFFLFFFLSKTFSSRQCSSGTGFDFSHPSSRIGVASKLTRDLSRSRGQSIFITDDEEDQDVATDLFRSQTVANLNSGSLKEKSTVNRFQERRRRVSS